MEQYTSAPIEGDHSIENYYQNKLKIDRGEIEKILKNNEPVTLDAIVSRLHIPADILEYHFENILIECNDEEKNSVCDRILEVRGAPTKDDQRSAQRLRVEKRRTIEEHQKEIARLTNEIETLSKSIESMGIKNNDLEHDLEKLKESLKKKEDEVDELQKFKEILEKDQSDQDSKTDELQKKLAEAEEKYSNVSLELTTANEKKSQLENELQVLKRKVLALEEQLLNKESIAPKNEAQSNLKLEAVVEEEEDDDEELEREAKELKKKRKLIIFAIGVGVFIFVISVFYYVFQSLKPEKPSVQASSPVLVPASTVQTPQPATVKSPVVVPAAPVEAKPSMILSFNDAQSFRAHSDQFKINGQSIIVDGQSFTVGDAINGFKVLSVDKTFFRLKDPVSGLEFRVDIAMAGGTY